MNCFPQTFQLVEKAHAGIHGGHDIFHAIRVATWAAWIALDEFDDKRTADLAWLAGICHNADRLVEREYGRGNAPDGATRTRLESWLAVSGTTPAERSMVMEAVMGHNKKNDPSHSPVQIALMDADKVVNMANDLIIRSGQLYHDLPAVDSVYFVNNPEATYRNPGSSLKDIWYSPAEWTDPNNPFCFRTRLGWEVGKQRAAHLNKFIETLRAQMEEDGIVFKA